MPSRGALLLAACALLARPAAGRSRAAAAFQTQKLPIEEHAASASGLVPSWLQGTLYRNVPNTYEAGPDQVWAWVDALASVHSLKFNGSNTVLHQARILESPTWADAQEKGRFDIVQYMTPKKGGPRPTGGHVPFPCNEQHGGPCLPDPNAPAAQSAEPQPPQPQPRGEQNLQGLIKLNCNPNVDVARYVAGNGSEMFVGLTDMAVYTRFAGDTLRTVDPGPCPFQDSHCGGLMAQGTLSAAHEKYDHNTGEHFNFFGHFKMLGTNTYQLTKYTDGQEGFGRWVGPEFKSKDLSFVHSSHLTQKYFIIQQPPAIYNFADLVEMKPVFNASKYDPDKPTVWHVLDRNTGAKVAEYSAANVQWEGRQLTRRTYFRGEGHPGSIFHTHTVNAFEGADGSITMDFIGWPDMAIFYGIGLELMVDNPRDYQETWEPARLTRCTIQPANSSVRCRIVVDKNFGLPNFNVEHYQSKPYRYAYGVSIESKATSDFADQLIKVDIEQGNITHMWQRDGCFVTEPVFIAHPDNSAEDAGVVISIVFDSAAESSFALILDAASFKELARVPVGFKVQAHYHGKFCKAYGNKACVGS
eukprot:TRINITY_DN4223_c4_g1_i1.p1 TRINITY_DN4223_c4_g1~~TRINITY_DN4223_c4_g1_i1.p1  ORF type:complete len:615 (+),score=240.45 TRINITY_DN4223_c4_g1_i1:91-1845(+)